MSQVLNISWKMTTGGTLQLNSGTRLCVVLLSRISQDLSCGAASVMCVMQLHGVPIMELGW